MLAPRPSGALPSCRSFQHTFLPSLRGRSHTRVGDQEQGSLVSFKWGRQVCSVLCPGSEAAPVPQSKPPQDQGPEVFVVPDFPEPWSLSPPQPFLPAWEQPPLPWTSEAHIRLIVGLLSVAPHPQPTWSWDAVAAPPPRGVQVSTRD